MTEDRWRNWALVAVGYAAGIAGLAGIRHTLPLLESALIALLLPSSAAVIEVSTAVILAKDPSNIEDRSLATTYSRILLGVILFIVALHVLAVSVLTGVVPRSPWLARAPIVLFGLLAVWVGNLLPRTRPNLALGIRTQRTLWDRETWIRTHRIAGYLSVMLGVLFVMSGMFFPKQHMESIVGPISIIAALLLTVEHLRSRAA